MSDWIILSLMICILSSCANYEELLEKRRGTEYVIDNTSFGRYAIMRAHDYSQYFLIAFQNRSQLVKGDRLLINPSYEACREPCEAYLNENFIVEVPLQVLLEADDKAEAYKAFNQFRDL